MNITLNGEKIELHSGITLSGLLEEKNMTGQKRMALLVNGNIVQMEKAGETLLQENDTVEVITLAAGG